MAWRGSRLFADTFDQTPVHLSKIHTTPTTSYLRADFAGKSINLSPHLSPAIFIGQMESLKDRPGRPWGVS
jgi:hypothetical protein